MLIQSKIAGENYGEGGKEFVCFCQILMVMKMPKAEDGRKREKIFEIFSFVYREKNRTLTIHDDNSNYN